MSREKSLEVIIVLALASLLSSMWFDDARWLLYISTGLLMVSLIFRRLTDLIGKGWFSFSYFLGVIMNNLIMFVIFYLFLVPLALLQRLSGNNPIHIKKAGDTYFHKRDHLFVRKDIERPW